MIYKCTSPCLTLFQVSHAYVNSPDIYIKLDFLLWMSCCCCCCCCWVISVVSDSMWPHRRQPTRLCRPWESPGKNTGVGCHFLLQYMKVKSESEVAQSCPTLSYPMDCRLLCPWDFSGKSTGVGCHCLLIIWLAKRNKRGKKNTTTPFLLASITHLISEETNRVL